MDGINVIWFIGALLFIVTGFVFQDAKWYSKLIKLNNKAKGTKTNITTQTFLVGRTMGYGFIILGILSIILIFLGY